MADLFTGTTGLNDKNDPVRLKYADGVVELASAVNIDIDSTGRPKRRAGYSTVASTVVHSLFKVGDYALCVYNGNLSVLERDQTVSTITSVQKYLRMSYVNVFNGLTDEIYYSNGVDKGKVVNKSYSAWTGDDYVGPDTVRTYSDPVAGHLLELYNGRIYVCRENIAWYSERFAYSWFDYSQNYLPFNSRLRMFRAVKSGIFASDDSATYYLGGPDPQEFTITKVCNYPAIEGTDILVDGNSIGSGEIQGRVLVWAGTEGICMGGNDGFFTNLTERKLSMPTARYGSALFKDRKLIFSLEP